MPAVVRVSLTWVLLAVAHLAHAADARMPWAFVSGSAKGYSVRLESASPMPGMPLAVGQSVEYSDTVSYQLSMGNRVRSFWSFKMRPIRVSRLARISKCR